MNNGNEKLSINTPQSGEIRRMARQFLSIGFDTQKLLLVEDFPDHQKFLYILGVLEIPDFPSVQVSFSKAFILQLQDDLDSGSLQNRHKGDLAEALAIRVFKKAGTLPTDQEGLSKSISNRQNRIGSFYLEKEPEGWSFTHRIIIPEYRKQGIGSQILQYADTFFQEIADTSKDHQSLLINAGQKSMIEFASNRGYRPQSESDKTCLEQLESGAFEQRIASVRINGQWRAQIDSDPYLFEKNSTHQAIKDAIRVRLVKIIEPQNKS